MQELLPLERQERALLLELLLVALVQVQVLGLAQVPEQVLLREQ